MSRLTRFVRRRLSAARPGAPPSDAPPSGAPPSGAPPSDAGGVPWGFRPIDDTRPEDVFVAGFAKSGNTWCQAIISSLKYGIDVSRTPDVLTQLIVPDAQAVRTYLRLDDGPTCFKTHLPPRPHVRRAVVLVRDGRDVLTSLRHFRGNLKGVMPTWREMLDGGTAEAWRDHLLAWHENPFGADLLTLRYEDLKADGPAAAASLAEFLGLELPDEEIRRAVETCRFDRMQRREQTFGFLNKSWPKEKAFVRRGEVGSHRDEVPAEVLREFEERAADALRLHGYAP